MDLYGYLPSIFQATLSDLLLAVHAPRGLLGFHPVFCAGHEPIIPAGNLDNVAKVNQEAPHRRTGAVFIDQRLLSNRLERADRRQPLWSKRSRVRRTSWSHHPLVLHASAIVVDSSGGGPESSRGP